MADGLLTALATPALFLQYEDVLKRPEKLSASNQWIAAAVAQKVGAVETAADFFRRRAAGAHPADLEAFLASAPDLPAEPGDEIPDRLRTLLGQPGPKPGARR